MSKVNLFQLITLHCPYLSQCKGINTSIRKYQGQTIANNYRHPIVLTTQAVAAPAAPSSAGAGCVLAGCVLAGCVAASAPAGCVAASIPAGCAAASVSAGCAAASGCTADSALADGAAVPIGAVSNDGKGPTAMLLRLLILIPVAGSSVA
ncbi:hypothetical protein BC937DRAFT_90150 [Endogone sp. FLAS-F59071]|nr:hypothetical protein BC937DRAFT_90150 [Endogone sp. FLAS-F59071]|eukprot:RUS17306.1 hypothetical protein BC937DRAFT_90150 [Endogone sp. FLAS-F59071]